MSTKENKIMADIIWGNFMGLRPEERTKKRLELATDKLPEIYQEVVSPFFDDMMGAMISQHSGSATRITATVYLVAVLEPTEYDAKVLNYILNHCSANNCFPRLILDRKNIDDLRYECVNKSESITVEGALDLWAQSIFAYLDPAMPGGFANKPIMLQCAPYPGPPERIIVQFNPDFLKMLSKHLKTNQIELTPEDFQDL